MKWEMPNIQSTRSTGGKWKQARGSQVAQSPREPSLEDQSRRCALVPGTLAVCPDVTDTYKHGNIPSYLQFYFLCHDPCSCQATHSMPTCVSKLPCISGLQSSRYLRLKSEWPEKVNKVSTHSESLKFSGNLQKKLRESGKVINVILSFMLSF